MLLCHCGTQSMLSLCRREIGEFCSACVFMVVFFSFKRRVTRSGESLQKEWRLPLPGEERSTLKQRRFQRVQEVEWKRAQSLATCSSTEKLEIREPWQDQEAASQLSNRIERKLLEYSWLEVRICLERLESNAGIINNPFVLLWSLSWSLSVKV